DKKSVAGGLRGGGVRAPAPTDAKGDLDASFRLAGTALETAKGTVALTARADVNGRRIDRLKLDTVIGGGVARADGTVTAEGAQAQLHADVKLGNPIVIDGARVRAQLADLGAVAPGVKGSASADVNVSGTPQDLAAKGRAHADGIVAGSARVASADVSFDVTKRGQGFAGSAKLDAFGVSAAKNPFGRVRADATFDGGKTVAVNLNVGG